MVAVAAVAVVAAAAVVGRRWEKSQDPVAASVAGVVAAVVCLNLGRRKDCLPVAVAVVCPIPSLRMDHCRSAVAAAAAAAAGPAHQTGCSGGSAEPRIQIKTLPVVPARKDLLSVTRSLTQRRQTTAAEGSATQIKTSRCTRDESIGRTKLERRAEIQCRQVRNVRRG